MSKIIVHLLLIALAVLLVWLSGYYYGLSKHTYEHIYTDMVDVYNGYMLKQCLAGEYE